MKFNLFAVGTIALCFLQQIQAETQPATGVVLSNESIKAIVAALGPEVTNAVKEALSVTQNVQGDKLVRRDVAGTVENGGYGTLEEKVTNELIKRGIISGDATGVASGDLLGLQPLIEDLLKTIVKLEQGILKKVVPDVTKLVVDVNGVVTDLVTIVKSIDLSEIATDVQVIVKTVLVNVSKLLEFLGAEVSELSEVIDKVLGDVIAKNPVTGKGDITINNLLDLVTSILHDVDSLLGKVNIDGLLQSVFDLVQNLVNGILKLDPKATDATKRALLRRNLIKRAAVARNAAF